MAPTVGSSGISTMSWPTTVIEISCGGRRGADRRESRQQRLRGQPTAVGSIPYAVTPFSERSVRLEAGVQLLHVITVGSQNERTEAFGDHREVGIDDV